MKICHVTSAHKNNDTRIYHKQCISLRDAGYEVNLIAPGNQDFMHEGIKVYGVPQKKKNRYYRMLLTTREVYRKCKEVDADLYHLHDPELLPYALFLKMRGKKVIFDSHEDYVSTISEKSYIPLIFRKAATKIFSMFEGWVIKKIDGAVVCYHWTEERYKKIQRNVRMVLNYPRNKDAAFKNYEVMNNETINLCFAGGISKQWMHTNILESLLSLEDVKYNLAGKNGTAYFEALVRHPAWQKVSYKGVLNFDDVYKEVYMKSDIGMVLLDYIPQCKYTIGNLSNTKFFEVMQMGLPLICTDFKLWKEIVEEERCGICVNPNNTNEIIEAIKYLIENPDEAREMGIRGSLAIDKKYNWENEEKVLLGLYDDIFKNT